MIDIQIIERPELSNEALNELFAQAWPSHTTRDFAPLFAQSLVYFAAFEAQRLVGFVNVAWDGGAHAFVLDPTVLQRVQRRGVGTTLVRRAIEAAAGRGVEWVHVDYERHWLRSTRRSGSGQPAPECYAFGHPNEAGRRVRLANERCCRQRQ